MRIRNTSWELRRPVCKADRLTKFMCRIFWNPGTSNSWNTQGLSRPVMGLLYLHFLPFFIIKKNIFKTYTFRHCQTITSRHSGTFVTFIIRHITAVLQLAVPFTTLPLGTLPDVTVTSVLTFRHTTMQCSSPLFAAPYVVRYDVTRTAAGTQMCCLRVWYLYY
jgi:hypothetical protein